MSINPLIGIRKTLNNVKKHLRTEIVECKRVKRELGVVLHE